LCYVYNISYRDNENKYSITNPVYSGTTDFKVINKQYVTMFLKNEDTKQEAHIYDTIAEQKEIKPKNKTPVLYDYCDAIKPNIFPSDVLGGHSTSNTKENEAHDTKRSEVISLPGDTSKPTATSDTKTYSEPHTSEYPPKHYASLDITHHEAPRCYSKPTTIPASETYNEPDTSEHLHPLKHYASLDITHHKAPSCYSKPTTSETYSEPHTSEHPEKRYASLDTTHAHHDATTEYQKLVNQPAGHVTLL